METKNIMNEIPKNLPLNPDYMIYFAPPKTGSSTVMAALRTIGVPCHRCHPGNIAQYHRQDYPTITGVREPISWLFSKIFEFSTQHGVTISPDDAPEFVDEIMNGEFRKELDDYVNFFAGIYRQTTGINIYGQRWIKKTPWMIYSIRGLIVRTDKFNDVLETALRSFLPAYYPDLDLSTLEVEHRAKGVDRFEGYEEFMENVAFDKYWLANFYDKCEMTRYFFYAKELKDWIVKWALKGEK